MARTLLWAVPLALALAAPAEAGWNEFWHRFQVDFHRNNCWPSPFYQADRVMVRAPFDAMVHKGWYLHNTLGGSDFIEESGSLSSAGRARLRGILASVRGGQQGILVTEGRGDDETHRRLESVQQELARHLPADRIPPVLPVTGEPATWPADYVDTVERQLQQTIPTPRLPPREAAGGD